MIKSLIVFLFFIFTFSCEKGRGLVDTNIQTHNVDFNENDIIGTWKMDTFSYKNISSDERIDSIYIIFHENNEFTVNNSKKLFKISPQGNIKNGIIDNKISNGKWKITQYQYREKIHKTLDFIYDNNTSQSGLNVYKKGDEYQIWYFFGDPDAGHRLRFLKIK